MFPGSKVQASAAHHVHACGLQTAHQCFPVPPRGPAAPPQPPPAGIPQTDLTITEVDEWGLFPAGFEEFGLKELPIKIHPRAAVLPGHRLATRVVCKQGHVHTTHEES